MRLLKSLNKSFKSKVKKEEAPKTDESGAVKEHNALADLIHPNRDDDTDNFTPTLFPTITASAKGGAGPEVNMINIDVGDNKSKKESMLKQFDDMEIKDSGTNEDGDDLLDLMDNS